MRVLKKISTPFTESNPERAIIVVNAIDTQLHTVKSYTQACDDVEIPFVVFVNKIDKRDKRHTKEWFRKQLGQKEIEWGSVRTGTGISDIKKYINLWKGKRIAVLGVFNSGKTSLINELCGTNYKTDDIPGTTLKFTETTLKDKTVIIDSVGQLIDIHKPMMVSIDFSDCSDRYDKVQKVFNEEITGIVRSKESSVTEIVVIVDIIRKQIEKGKKIVVTGAGASALVAREIAGQGTECGIPIMVFTNDGSEVQPVTFSKGLGEQEGGISKYIANAINPGDVVIAVSASGGTGFTYDLLRRAKLIGAVTMAITENADTRLGKYADYILKSDSKPEGPCLHPDTPILTRNKGLINVSNIKSGDEVLTIKYAKFHKDNIKYHNTVGFQIRGLKWGKVSNTLKSNAKYLYEITYCNGGIIKATPNHTFFISNTSGTKPIIASELKKNDILITLPKNIKSNDIGLSESQDLETMELLGYYASEGSLGNGSVIFSIGSHEQKFKNRIIYLMKEKFNANHWIRDKRPENNGLDVWCYSPKARKLFESSCGRGAWHKHIPNILWTSDRNSFVTFLKAYIRGDGNITTEEKSRGRSVSRHMLEELSWLCRLHNIPCSLSEMIQPERKIRDSILKESKIWQLQIGKNGWKEFIGTNTPNIVDWKTPYGITKRDLSKPQSNRNIIKSINKVPYNGEVIDIIDCDGDVFYIGNIPILSHNSSSKIQTAHLVIGHSIILVLADEMGVTADEAVGHMLPDRLDNKMMGIK